MAKMVFALPEARAVLRSLPQSELHALAALQATARLTDYGAVNIQTQVLARSKGSTYIVSDDPDGEPHQAITRDEWERVSTAQDEFIAAQEMVQVDGYIGNDPERRVPARLYIESRNVNIAGMQDVLYFPHEESEPFEPELLARAGDHARQRIVGDGRVGDRGAGDEPHRLGEPDAVHRRALDRAQPIERRAQARTIQLDPPPAQEAQAIAAGEQLGELGVGERLAVERDRRAEVEQRVAAEPGRRVRADGRRRGGARGSPAVPAGGHTHDHAGGLELRRVDEQAHRIGRRPPQRMEQLVVLDHLDEPRARVGRAPHRLEQRAQLRLRARARVFVQRLAERDVLRRRARAEPRRVRREERERRRVVAAILGEVEADAADEVPRRVTRAQERRDVGVADRGHERGVERTPDLGDDHIGDVIRRRSSAARSRRTRPARPHRAGQFHASGIRPCPCTPPRRRRRCLRQLVASSSMLGGSRVSTSTVPSCTSPAPAPFANAATIRAPAACSIGSPSSGAARRTTRRPAGVTATVIVASRPDDDCGRGAATDDE